MTTSPTPPCNHTFMTQNIHRELPPLYFSTATLTSRTLTILGDAYRYLKAHCRTRSPFEAREIQILRQELEEGMSRDRREQTQYYVLQIQDMRKRKAMELYLARYSGFVMYGDGRLDYGLAVIGDGDHSVGVLESLKDNLKVAGCRIM